jgi:hypothetical protein
VSVRVRLRLRVRDSDILVGSLRLMSYFLRVLS